MSVLDHAMFASIDWTRPWYDSIRSIAATLGDEANWLASLNEQAISRALTNHRDLPLRFVEQSSLPQDIAYESFISHAGQVPTRHNLHDYFNALVWLGFPDIKRQLNATQATQIETSGIGQSRGRARDAATIFDENCALLVVNDSTQGTGLLEALRSHQWREVFHDQRQLFSQHIEVWLFGHALMEKLVTPYKAITAHALPITMPDEFFALSHEKKRMRLDQQVALDLQLHGVNTSRFTPLPVLGVPGWWQAQDESFYSDVSVFRAKSQR